MWARINVWRIMYGKYLAWCVSVWLDVCLCVCEKESLNWQIFPEVLCKWHAVLSLFMWARKLRVMNFVRKVFSLVCCCTVRRWWLQLMFLLNFWFMVDGKETVKLCGKRKTIDILILDFVAEVRTNFDGSSLFLLGWGLSSGWDGHQTPFFNVFLLFDGEKSTVAIHWCV